MLANVGPDWGGIAAGAVGAAVIRRRAQAAPLSQSSASEPVIHGAALWQDPRFMFWVLISVSFGHVLGTLETGALPIALNHERASLSGVALIAGAAVASILFGIAYASFSERIPGSEPGRAMIMLGAMAAACVVLSISAAWALVVVGAVLIRACTAPINIICQVATERTVAPSRQAEAFGDLFAANGVGFGLAGVLLATLPLAWMLAGGGTTSVISIAYWVLIARNEQRA